jgi:hypothetical protein
MAQLRKSQSGNSTGTRRFSRVDTPFDPLDHEVIRSFSCLLRAIHSGGKTSVPQECL